MKKGFFEGIIVLDHTRYLTGGYVTQMLADMGCTVIKVEEIEQGDYCRHEPPLNHGLGSHFVAIGRNKKSFTVDFKNPQGKEAYLRLAAHADVVVENYRPGVMTSLGIDYETVKEKNPGIIHCAISGFGKDDPRSKKALHDCNLQALSGFQDINQGQTTPLHICDLSTAMVASQAILAALCQRTLSGEGSFCDIRMFDSFVWWQALLYQRWQFNGESQTHEDIEYPAVAYNYYETKDGRYFSIGMVEKKFWVSFCQDLGIEELIDHHLDRRWEAPHAFEKVEALFKTRTFDEWQVYFDEHDTCAAPVYTIEEAIANIMKSSSGLVDYRDFPLLGKTIQVNSPHNVSSIPMDLNSATEPPILGRDNEDILRELGYSSAEIDTMMDMHAVGPSSRRIWYDNAISVDKETGGRIDEQTEFEDQASAHAVA